MKTRNTKKLPVKKAVAPLDATVSDFQTHGTRALFGPVDIASMVLLRMLFGAIMLWEVSRYFRFDFIGRYWVEPQFHFTYWPFDFLEPLPGEGMYQLFLLLGLLAFCILVGLFYRISTILFFLLFSYTYLLEQTRYLNHFYLVILISFLLIFIPSHKAFSLDVRRGSVPRSDTLPAWCLWLMRFTIGLPYFFGGIAKINSDWLQGEPMRSWLQYDTDFPLIGHLFTEDWMIYVISYSGLLLDLLVIPFLLFRKTRNWAFAAAVLFHLMNAQLFTIGIFPWFMLVATSLFFHPSWPRRVWYSLHLSKKRLVLVAPEELLQPVRQREKWILGLLLMWVGIHSFLPFRHVLFPGNVHWTEEGHKYAWHMKLRSKVAEASFRVRDKQTGEEEVINNRDYLTRWQERRMAGWPNLVWQYSRIIRDEYRSRGRDVSVHAHVVASLNGRRHQHLVDTLVDLAAAPRRIFGHDPWIRQLEVPLSERSKHESEESEE